MSHVKQNIFALINIFILGVITFLKLLASIIKAAGYIVIYFIIFVLVYFFAMFIESFQFSTLFENLEALFALPIVFLLGGAIGGIFFVVLFGMYYLIGLAIGLFNTVWMAVAKAVCKAIEYLVSILVNKLYLPIYRKYCKIDQRACFLSFDYVKRRKTGEQTDRIKASINKKSDINQCITALGVNVLYGMEYLFYILASRKNFFVWFCTLGFILTFIIHENHYCLVLAGMNYVEYLLLFNWQDLLASAIVIIYLMFCIFLLTNEMMDHLDDYVIFTQDVLKKHMGQSTVKKEGPCNEILIEEL